MDPQDKIQAAADYIRGKVKRIPRTALILGSGLGVLAEEVQDPVSIPYSEIPHFPVSTAPGHAGVFTAGTLEGQEVIVMGGRFHYYEGYDMDSIAFPIRVMKSLGVDTLLLTNAAGGVNEEYKPGDLMIITDHLNMVGQNPLRGPNDEQLGPRFPDLSTLYNPELSGMLEATAKENGIDYQKGVYAWMSGPSFETPAEIRMLRSIGADAVGMSTVPEAITAHHCGIRVAGVSCISNMAAGVLDQPITQEEVFEVAKLVRERFSLLIRQTLSRMAAI
ncbi:MAG: purine-nucleoside phosphorylase [Spirochaetota bacterium]